MRDAPVILFYIYIYSKHVNINPLTGEFISGKK